MLDFYNRLERELTADEFDKVIYYIQKAQSLYNDGADDKARDTLDDAVAILKAAGEYSAAKKVEYYKRFM